MPATRPIQYELPNNEVQYANATVRVGRAEFAFDARDGVRRVNVPAVSGVRIAGATPIRGASGIGGTTNIVGTPQRSFPS